MKRFSIHIISLLMLISAAMTGCKQEPRSDTAPKPGVVGDPKGRDIYYVTSLAGKSKRWSTRSVTYLPNGSVQFIHEETKRPVIVSQPFSVEFGFKIAEGWK